MSALIFRWICRINPGKASESVTLVSNRSAQINSCVFASTDRCSFRQIRRRSLPCFFDFLLTFTENLQSCGINHRMRDLMPGGRFKTDVNRLCPLADTCVIRQRSGTPIRVKMESIKPCAARRVSQNTRLTTRTV